MPPITLTADMPIMLSDKFRQRIDRGERLVRVRSMPLTVFMDAHERQSDTNHRQTLARIRERGGFDATEMVAVLACLPYRQIEGLSEEAAHRILYAITSIHNRGMRVAESVERQGEPEPPRPVEARIIEAAEQRILARCGEGRAGVVEKLRTDPVTKALFDVAARALAEEIRHG